MEVILALLIPSVFAAVIFYFLCLAILKDDSPHKKDSLDKIAAIKNIEWIKSYGEQSKHKDS